MHPPHGGAARKCKTSSTQARLPVDWKQTTEQGRRQMVVRYKFIMEEIDVATGGGIRNHPEHFQFLDVCCSPGGFSEYVLANTQSRGVGLTLPLELGGHVPAIDKKNIATPDRYDMYFVDVTTVASTIYMEPVYGNTKQPLDCIRILPPGGEAPPELCNNCDVMILDGSFLGGKGFYSHTIYQNDEDNPAFNVYESSIAADQALLVSQLIIMVHNLKRGGHVVLRLSMTWNDFRNGVLCLLRRMFTGTIVNYKPRSTHQDKISYYLACSGFDPEVAEGLQFAPTMQQLVDKLRAGEASARFVPFPQLPEGGAQGLYHNFWRPSFNAYYHNLHAFLYLIRLVKEYQQQSGDARLFKWSPCIEFLLSRKACRDSKCKCAHTFEELHPIAQEASRLDNGYMEWPQQAVIRQAQLDALGDPVKRAMLRTQMQVQQQRQAVMQQAMMQQQQEQAAMMQQQHMMMAGMSMFGSLDPSHWNRMIAMQLYGMLKQAQAYGGGVQLLMDRPDLYTQDDAVMTDVQQAAMYGGIAAQNTAAVTEADQNLGQRPGSLTAREAEAPGQGREPAGTAPTTKLHKSEEGDMAAARLKLLDAAVAGGAGSSKAAAPGSEPSSGTGGAEAQGGATKAVIQEAASAADPEQQQRSRASAVPQVSGYLQWMTMVKVVIADEYTKNELLSFLGE